MSDLAEKRIMIQNELGLHARAATKLVQLADAIESLGTRIEAAVQPGGVPPFVLADIPQGLPAYFEHRGVILGNDGCGTRRAG